MPYPITQLPSWKEVAEQLEKHGILLKTSECHLQCNDSDPSPIRYFEQKGGGTYVVCFENENERLMPTMIRSICAAFDINPSEFGLTLG